MKITPLASESMGTRSMAVLVETKDCRILIDPGASLGPLRFGLEPHMLELEKLAIAKKAIFDKARKADILTVSHYHYDHHDPASPKIFRGKKVFLKHPTEKINISQKGRAAELLKAIEGLPASLEFSDGKTFEFGKTTLAFSEPVPHGTNTKLGYVVELAVSEGKSTFVHTSDVEGPSLKEQASFIIKAQPTVVACDGPMTYMMHRYGKKALKASNSNLVRIIEKTPVENLLLDHHFLRDPKWKSKIKPVLKAGRENGCKVQSFAGYLGKKDELLEARRKELWKGTA